MKSESTINSNKILQYGSLITIQDMSKGQKILYNDGYLRLNTLVSDLSNSIISNDIYGCIFQIIPKYTYEYYEKLDDL